MHAQWITGSMVLLVGASIAVIGKVRCVAAPTSPHIYWADSSNNIVHADLDGSNVAKIKLDYGNIGDFVIDKRTSLLYWNTGEYIFRSHLDGSNKSTLFHAPGSSFRGDVTIDPIRNFLFFVDARNNIVYRSELDGSNLTQIVRARGTASNGDGITDLWLNAPAGKIYWNFRSTFYRTNLDGSQEEMLFTAPKSIDDFEIDPLNEKIYWGDGSSAQAPGSVRRANLDGSDQQVLASGLSIVDGIALDLPDQRIYYTDLPATGPFDYDSTIRVSNLDGSSPRILLNLGTGPYPFEITLDTAIVSEPRTGILAILGGCLIWRWRIRFNA
jgi:hypothetical protein